MASYPRHARITDTDRGPLLNIASWTLMCTTVLFTIFRLISNAVLRGRVSGDDWIVLVATALAVMQAIAASFLVANGIGQHQDTLSATRLMRYQKALLASSVLYISTLAFSKFSLLFFLSRVIPVPKKTFRLLIKMTWVVMGLYLVSEVFTLSFQCSPPKVYDFIGGQCIKLLAFWDFDAAFDVVSSLAILALPMIVVQPVQMRKRRKFQAVSAFTFQIPACAFAIVRLVYLHRALDDTDHTWAAVNWQIWTSINMHFNVIAANIPCLKVFLEGFQSTLLRADLHSSNSGNDDPESEMSKRKDSRPDSIQPASQRAVGRKTSRGIFSNKSRSDESESNKAIGTVSAAKPDRNGFEEADTSEEVITKVK